MLSYANPHMPPQPSPSLRSCQVYHTNTHQPAYQPPQGRPKSGPEPKFSLNPVVPRLSELLGAPVLKADDCIGAPVEAKLKEMSNGQVRP